LDDPNGGREGKVSAAVGVELVANQKTIQTDMHIPTHYPKDVLLVVVEGDPANQSQVQVPDDDNLSNEGCIEDDLSPKHSHALMGSRASQYSLSSVQESPVNISSDSSDFSNTTCLTVFLFARGSPPRLFPLGMDEDSLNITTQITYQMEELTITTTGLQITKSVAIKQKPPRC